MVPVVRAVGVPAVGVTLAAVLWWQPWHPGSPAPAGDPDFPVVDMPPIPVRPDSEEPYRPFTPADADAVRAEFAQHGRGTSHPRPAAP